MQRICTSPRCKHVFESDGSAVCPICGAITQEYQLKPNRLSPSELEEISKHLSTNWRFIAVVAVVAATALFTLFSLFYGGSIFGTLKDIRNETNRRLQQLNHDMSNVVAQTHSEISSNIVRQFEEPRIRMLVSQVASNEARRLILSQINPEVERFEKQISEKVDQINALASNAVLTVKRLEEQSQFLSVMTGALSGSRKNYEQLVKWSKDQSYAFQADAASAVSSAALLNFPNPLSVTFNLKWRDGIDPAKLTMQEIITFFQYLPGQNHQAYVAFVWNRNDLPKRDRMEFLLNVILNDENLRAVLYAVQLFAGESKLEMQSRDWGEYKDWWEANKDKIK